MRNMYLNADTFSGCCGIKELYDFEELFKDSSNWGDPVVDKEALTDAEWYFAIYSGIRDKLTSIALCVFSHSSGDNVGPFTPAKLAAWLRSKGEKVSTGATGINPESGNKITLYSWAPSKKFLNNHKKKNDARNASRGAQAA